MQPELERLIRQHLDPAGVDPATIEPFLAALDSHCRCTGVAPDAADGYADLLEQLAEKQRSESHLEDLLFLLGTAVELTADGILVLDRSGRIIRFNQSFAQMWRLPDELLAFWTHDGVLQHMLARVADPNAFADKLADLCRLPDADCDDTFECRDGRVIERRSLPHPPGVEIVGRVVSFHDITERRRAEQQLLREKEAQRKLIRKLEAAHSQLLQTEKLASIGHLAAGVAHEINNPIGFVNSNLGALRRYVAGLLALLRSYEALDPLLPEGVAHDRVAAVKREVDIEYVKSDITDLLNETADGIARVRNIVQDLRDFAQGDQGEWVVADLHKGLESTLNLLGKFLQGKARVVKQYDGTLPPVRCLPVQINQVVMNLLVNAVEAIPREGIIYVRTGAEGEHVYLEIEDTGVGIPADRLNRIFDPFYTTKQAGTGAGLGLSTAYGIVEKHQGHIEVHSEPGHGSVFRILLPCGLEEPPAGPRPDLCTCSQDPER